MKYKPAWKGKLRVEANGDVYWQGRYRGRVTSKPSPGATSPGGMVTNTVWFSHDRNGEKQHQSMTQAIESLLPK